MSLEFNRRSFLKYSAAAAVAVAGSSLLVGCGEDEYQKTGKIGSTLKLMGTFTLESASLNSVSSSSTLTCKFNLAKTGCRYHCEQRAVYRNIIIINASHHLACDMYSCYHKFAKI